MAADFEDMMLRGNYELNELEGINQKYLNRHGPMVNKKKGRIALTYKQQIMIVAYMHRTKLGPRYEAQQAQIIEKIPHLIDMCLIAAVEMQKAYSQGVSQKNMNFQTMKHIIKFSKYFMHGLWEGDSELLQLPYSTPEVVKSIGKKMKRKNPTLKEYMALAPADREK